MGVPAVSVVVRTLGKTAWLAEALESLARQAFRNFEAVVVDMSGGSASRTIDACAPRLPGIRRVEIGRPIPRPAALNAGVDASAAPVIAVLDEDDLFDPPHLGHLLNELHGGGDDYVYSGIRHATFDAEGRPLAVREVSVPFDYHRLLFGNFIYPSASAFRRSLWDRVGGCDERFTVFEDWEFLIRASRAGRIRHAPVVTAESRKFTGREDLSNFDLEVADVRRCHAGVHWKHRALYTPQMRRHLKLVYADCCARRVNPRRAPLRWKVRGWRLEAGADLVSWVWWSEVAFRARGVRSGPSRTAPAAPPWRPPGSGGAASGGSSPPG